MVMAKKKLSTSFAKAAQTRDTGLYLIIPVPRVKKTGIIIFHSAISDSDTQDWEDIKLTSTSHCVDGVPMSREDFVRRKVAQRGTQFKLPSRDVIYNFCSEMMEFPDEFHAQVHIGRSPAMTGEHLAVPGNLFFNKNYMSWVVIGDFNRKAPPKELWDLTVVGVKKLMQCYAIKVVNVIGQHEAYPDLKLVPQTNSPGKYWSMPGFRRALIGA